MNISYACSLPWALCLWVLFICPHLLSLWAYQLFGSRMVLQCMRSWVTIWSTVSSKRKWAALSIFRDTAKEPVHASLSCYSMMLSLDQVWTNHTTAICSKLTLPQNRSLSYLLLWLSPFLLLCSSFSPTTYFPYLWPSPAKRCDINAITSALTSSANEKKWCFYDSVLLGWATLHCSCLRNNQVHNTQKIKWSHSALLGSQFASMPFSNVDLLDNCKTIFTQPC